jgi:outer membrane immunogenic protein
MGLPFKAPPSYAPAFSWTGTYVGANLGGTWGSFHMDPFSTNNVTGVVGAAAGASLSDTSLIGGFQAGYNWQVGQWVLGLEQDYQFTGLKKTFGFAAPAAGFLAGDTLSIKTDYLAATRAKLGWAADRVMLYAAGGLETGELDGSSTYVARGAPGSPALAFTNSDKLQSASMSAPASNMRSPTMCSSASSTVTSISARRLTTWALSHPRAGPPRR